MHLIAGAVLALLLTAAPVSPSGTEATRLTGVISEVGTIGTGIGDHSITNTEASQRLAVLRDAFKAVFP